MSNYKNELSRIEKEQKEIMKEFYKTMDCYYSRYEKKYPKIVACLRKAMKTRDFGECFRLQNKADEMIRKHGVRYLWELKI